MAETIEVIIRQGFFSCPQEVLDCVSDIEYGLSPVKQIAQSTLLEILLEGIGSARDDRKSFASSLLPLTFEEVVP
jgi:hypothetical protein